MTRLPRVVRWLLGRWVPADLRESFLGDLEELWSLRKAEGGRGSDRRWLWRQVLSAAALRLRRVSRPGAVERGAPRTTWRLGRDLRFAVRQLRRSPAYLLVVVLTVGLGVGATTAVFSVAYPVLWQPLPYPQADRLAMVFELDAQGGKRNVGWATFADLRGDSDLLASVAVMANWNPVLSGSGQPKPLVGQSVSAGFFSTLGVTPALGRGFTAQEDRPGANRVVIVGHRLWRDRLGGDPQVIGRSVSLGGAEYRVIGVLPDHFESLLAPTAEIWRPLGYDSALDWACRGCRHLRMIGRMDEGVTTRQLTTELSSLMAGYLEEHPDDYGQPEMRPVPLQDQLTARVRPALLLTALAGVLVLLMACTNLVHLVLTRFVQRRDEFAVRRALGADREVVVRQLLAEGAILAGLGAAVGLALAHLGVQALVATGANALPRLSAVTVDGTVWLFAFTLTLPVALLATLFPLAASGRDSARSSSRTVASGRGRRRWALGLVAGQVALAVVLLCGTGLLVRSLAAVLEVEPGFAPDRLLTVELIASGPELDEDVEIHRFADRVVAELSARPGVAHAALTSQIPLTGGFDRIGVTIEGRELAHHDDAPSPERYMVTGPYAEAMGIPLVRGRSLGLDDRAGSEPVVVINHSFARSHWPDSDPIGHRVRVGGTDATWRTIVGVVGDVQHMSLEAERTPQIYLPAAQWFYAVSRQFLVLRSEGSPEELAAAVRSSVRNVDAGVAIGTVTAGDRLVSRSTSRRRFVVRLFQAFGLTALLLAAAGVYSVLARSVAERRREMGIRSALGSDRWRIVRSAIGRGLSAAALGAAAGLVAAVGLSDLLRGLLFGVGPTDPATLASVVGLLVAVGVLAATVPAWQATRVDPIEALRSDESG